MQQEAVARFSPAARVRASAAPMLVSAAQVLVSAAPVAAQSERLAVLRACSPVSQGLVPFAEALREEELPWPSAELHVPL